MNQLVGAFLTARQLNHEFGIYISLLLAAGGPSYTASHSWVRSQEELAMQQLVEERNWVLPNLRQKRNININVSQAIKKPKNGWCLLLKIIKLG